MKAMKAMKAKDNKGNVKRAARGKAKAALTQWPVKKAMILTAEAHRAPPPLA